MTGNSTLLVLYDHLSEKSEIIRPVDLLLPGTLYSAETSAIFRDFEISPPKMIIDELLYKAGL
jgi:hypothetical protein